MKQYEGVRQELIRLELSGEKVRDTPDLCRELSFRYGVDFDTVFDLLVEVRCTPRSRFKEKRPVGRPRRTLSEDELSGLLDLLCRPAYEYGWHSALWTPQRVIKSSRSLGLTLKKDVVWGNLRRWGLSFNEQLERCLGERGIPAECEELLKERRGLFYVVTELHSSDFAIDLPAVGLVGLTTSRKVPLACAVQQYRHRIMTEFVEWFFKELLKLHPERHLVVLMRHKSAYRSERLRRLGLRHRRLHLFEV